MKLQKNIIIWELIILIFFLFFVLTLNKDTKIYDICMSLFSADLFALIFSVITYQYEKKTLLNKIYSNFSEMYYALHTIYLKLGKFLEEKDVSNTKFSLNYKLVVQISEAMSYLKNEEFTSFFDFKLHNQIKKLNNFSIKLYNLKNIIETRNTNILQFEIAVKDNMQSNQPNINNNQELFKCREDLLISLGRLHEYSCSLKIELDEIMTELDSICKFNNKWNDKKQYFEKDLEVRKNDL